MPQSHPTTGPVRFLSPVRFLARKAEWSARTSVLFSWSHQATGPVRLDTAVYLWFSWIIRMTPRVPRAVPVRASYGPRTGMFNIFHIPRDPYGARVGPARVPYGALTDTQGNWHNQNWQKNPHGRRILPYGPRTVPARAVHGLFKISKPVRARKLIMHALKLYRPRTGRQNSYGAARGPCGPREWTYDFCPKQPVNSPGTARTGPGSVMWLRH